MKRYCIVIDDRGDGIHEPIGFETPAGQFVSFADIQAWALQHKATVKGMRHGLVTGHKQPCLCVDCIQHEAIDIALREIEELLK